MKRIFAICLAGAALAACQTGEIGQPPVVPPPPPNQPPPPPPRNANGFDEGAFAWSKGTGGGGIVGSVNYGGGASAYTCGDVVLLPETPWTAARMERLYGSNTTAVAPVNDVRDRTPADAADRAESRISAGYARHAQCDASNRFSFAGLPNGAWYIITVATPRAGGQKVALMRRVASYGFVFRARLP